MRIGDSVPLTPADQQAQTIAAMRREIAELQRAASGATPTQAFIQRAANQTIGAGAFASISFDTITATSGLAAVTGTAPITLGVGIWGIQVYVFAGASLSGASYVRISVGSKNYDADIAEGDAVRGDHSIIHNVRSGTAALSAGVFNATGGGVAVNVDLLVVRLGNAA